MGASTLVIAAPHENVRSQCVVHMIHTHPSLLLPLSSPSPPPQVVANAVAALSEISETSPSAAALSSLDTSTINKLLTALNECTEWGQVFILDSVAQYSPKDEREAQRCGWGEGGKRRGWLVLCVVWWCTVTAVTDLSDMSLLSLACQTCHSCHWPVRHVTSPTAVWVSV